MKEAVKLSCILFSFILLITTLSCENEIDNNENPFDVPYKAGRPVVVEGISPAEGGLGTRVVVSGSNFGNDTSLTKLFFNNKEALILKIQDNAIYAMVPKQPGDSSTIRVVVKTGEDDDKTPVYTESLLENFQFKYHLKATVTTVAGVFGVNKSEDGTALEGTFTRPTRVIPDETGDNLIVSDDLGRRVRLVSLKDNKITTLLSGMNQPWGLIFTKGFTEFFSLERNAPVRPLLFYEFSKSTNWLEPNAFYDKKDAADNYIIGGIVLSGITVDEEYIYLLAQNGSRLFRIHQITENIEIIGENMNFGNWCAIDFNWKDRHIYVSTEGTGEIFRINPYHVPEGKNIPYLTFRDAVHVAGAGKGTVIEGNGIHARFGGIEDIASDREGNIYIADYTNHVIWKIDQEYNCKVFAGVPGQAGYKDGNPKEALFKGPWGLGSTPDGILYVADTGNFVIRCIAIQ